MVLLFDQTTVVPIRSFHSLKWWFNHLICSWTCSMNWLTSLAYLFCVVLCACVRVVFHQMPFFMHQFLMKHQNRMRLLIKVTIHAYYQLFFLTPTVFVGFIRSNKHSTKKKKEEQNSSRALRMDPVDVWGELLHTYTVHT